MLSPGPNVLTRSQLGAGCCIYMMCNLNQMNWKPVWNRGLFSEMWTLNMLQCCTKEDLQNWKWMLRRQQKANPAVFTGSVCCWNTTVWQPVQSFHHRSHESGSGNSSVVRTPDSWLNGHRFESLWELSSPGSTVCADSNFGICDRSTPCYQKKIARKRSQSFRQKCRWQVTAKHACTISMWLCKKWHGAWLYGVHRTCRDSNSFMWHQPCQCCKYISTPLGWIFKNTL